jgi:hypothetical protein
MNQPTPPVSPLMAIIFRLLNYIEIIAWALTGVGCAMLYSRTEGALEMLMVAMSVLSSVLFLRAYQPPNVPPALVENESDRPKGFFDLLGSTIAPKVMWIGSSVTVVGILFSLLKLKGAMEMLSIGCVMLPITAVLVGIFIVTRPAWAGTVMPPLYRAVPVWLVGVYLFMRSGI